MKIFEWISQGFLRPNPRPPYVYDKLSVVDIAATTIETSLPLPIDTDFILSVNAYARGGTGITTLYLQFDLVLSGRNVPVQRQRSATGTDIKDIFIFIEEIYVPRAASLYAFASFSAATAPNNLTLTCYGFAIPPADIL